jgi:hypothetical protein
MASAFAFGQNADLVLRKQESEVQGRIRRRGQYSVAGGGGGLRGRSNFGPDVPYHFGKTGERKRYDIYHL